MIDNSQIIGKVFHLSHNYAPKRKSNEKKGKICVSIRKPYHDVYQVIIKIIL